MITRNLPRKMSGLTPVIRWAGGKRALMRRILELLPDKFNAYHEPMLGGGALFFSIVPQQAYLSDINPELMNFYQILRTRPLELYASLVRVRPNKQTYYWMRSWRPTSKIQRAARFFYLVRLSWNGVFRVNRLGQFNVPYGGRQPKQLTSASKLLQASSALQHARLTFGDFESTTASVAAGDLVYFDPPYPRGTTNGNGFSRYSTAGFDLEDHRRLARHAAVLAERGALVLITEAARKEILRYYPRSFKINLVCRNSLIAASKTSRRKAYEAILTSY